MGATRVDIFDDPKGATYGELLRSLIPYSATFGVIVPRDKAELHPETRQKDS